jgi:hypothetical protein
MLAAFFSLWYAVYPIGPLYLEGYFASLLDNGEASSAIGICPEFVH